MMRSRWVVGSTVVLIVLCLSGGVSLARKRGLRTAEFLPQDALFAATMKLENLAGPYDAMLDFMGKFVPEEEAGQLLEPLEAWEAKVGVSLRDDVLALLGGEVAFSLAIEDIDRLGMMAMSMSSSGGPPDLGSLLGGVLFTVGVFDPERFDGSVARVLASVGGRLTVDADGLHTLHAADGSGVDAFLHYRYHSGFAVIGFSPESLSAAVARFEGGGGLRGSPQFQEVFSHLDPNPRAFGYVNLRHAQELLRGSNLVRAGLAQAPEMETFYRTFVQEWDWGSGIGWATYPVPGGTVQQTFAPFDMGAFAGAYGGILAAVAVPNFLNAVDRGKQKRTMADLRSLGTAVEAYAVDNNQYPIVAELTPVAETPLPELLSPLYIRTLPTVDAWNHAFYYTSAADGSSYTIYSFGKDGEPTEGSEGTTTSFDGDIVFQNGSFTAWPEGVQN